SHPARRLTSRTRAGLPSAANSAAVADASSADSAGDARGAQHDTGFATAAIVKSENTDLSVRRQAPVGAAALATDTCGRLSDRRSPGPLGAARTPNPSLRANARLSLRVGTKDADASAWTDVVRSHVGDQLLARGR